MVATDPSLDQLYDFCQLDTDTSYFATEYRNSLPWDYPNRNGFDPEEPLTAIAKREKKGFIYSPFDYLGGVSLLAD